MGVGMMGTSRGHEGHRGHWRDIPHPTRRTLGTFCQRAWLPTQGCQYLPHIFTHGGTVCPDDDAKLGGEAEAPEEPDSQRDLSRWRNLVKFNQGKSPKIRITWEGW